MVGTFKLKLLYQILTNVLGNIYTSLISNDDDVHIGLPNTVDGDRSHYQYHYIFSNYMYIQSMSCYGTGTICKGKTILNLFYLLTLLFYLLTLITHLKLDASPLYQQLCCISSLLGDCFCDIVLKFDNA